MIPYGMTKTAQVAVARGVAESVAGNRCHRELGSGEPDGVGRCRQFRREQAKQQNISEAKVEKQFFETVRPTSLLKRFEPPKK